MIVRPISRALAKTYCASHPHASSLPNSSKYYMAAYENGGFLGLAVWGWGVLPAATPKKLFGAGDTTEYLELNRFFVVDGVKNAASQFLNICAKIIKKYAPHVKWLYTYAAGFQGLVGTIYQAAGYEYIGTQVCTVYYLPKQNKMVHPMAVYHRYKKAKLDDLKQIFGDCIEWSGYNFCYIKFLCSPEEKANYLKKAKFQILPYPTQKDLKIWDNERNTIDIKHAKTVPLVKLSTRQIA